jgi:hypothetical protein
LPESIAVPRLSIIVPHLHDDSGLELTLLSILENRGRDLEVLISHDGSYTDPYSLGQDEAVLIESRKGSSLSSQLNLAVASACSPYIQVLMPGTVLENGWYNEALEIISNPSHSISAVCSPIACNDSDEIIVGLSGESLPHRRVTGKASLVAGPLIFGSVIRKRLFNAVGGWMEGCNREIAEVEFALLIEALDMEISIAETVGIYAPKRIVHGVEAGYEIGHACGQLACAYSSIEDSGVIISSLAQRLGHLASGLMSPKTVAERLGWVMGIRNREYVLKIRDRIVAATEALSQQPDSSSRSNSSLSTERRRAA